MRHIIRAITCALQDPGAEVFYVDEMKFPLNQTPTNHWSDRNLPDQLAWGERVSKMILTAIAICSIRRFEAVQLYKTETTSWSFKYFIESFISALPPKKRYLIVLDNATWHKGKEMADVKVQKFFLYNEPQQYQLNMIENCFSYVRPLFRKRPLVHTIEEEAKQILNMFFDRDIERKFVAFFRNHIRSLLITGLRYRHTPSENNNPPVEEDMQNPPD
jgi:DDE superfamily endonuclease